MAGFRLYISNRLENLAAKLAEVLQTPPVSPLDPEIIVVQSKGMERWVSLEIARHLGVCANVHFPFPKVFIKNLMAHVLEERIDDQSFEPAVMTWKIMRLLPSLIARPGFSNIADYLQGERGALKLFQLSGQIASLFDQYMIFRPDMITSWEKGIQPDEGQWQAELFQAMASKSGGLNPAALKQSFLKSMAHLSPAQAALPARVSVFGISSLPRFHMDLFHTLSGQMEINLFLMNPCREFWFDIRSDREIGRQVEKSGAGRNKRVNKEGLYLEKGNSLLASMGTLGRDFLSHVMEYDAEEWENYEEPGTEHLLGALQSDILNLRDCGGDCSGNPIVDRNDDTIRIHNCHSAMREIEVLYDNLLSMFEKNPELLPRDVLVMTPDIDTYAPLVAAVFDATADSVREMSADKRRIPYSIADRSLTKDSRISDGFRMILDLSGKRFSSNEVLALLEKEAVYRKYDLGEADVELVRRWIRDTRIRWGIDGKNRQEMGLPGYHENTWQAGLDRLLLGYAMTGEDIHLFNGILPYDSMEGDAAIVLGKLLAFTESLFKSVDSFTKATTPAGWSRRLADILDTFFLADEDTEEEIQVVRHTISSLSEVVEKAGFEETVDIDVIRCFLKDALEKEDMGFGFMTGDVTFCAMLPMRSIPFKVICLLGMNNNNYPRHSRTLGFDLMARNPLPGDRSRRNDDRYLFLEALLSARERFYISYVGQSIQDNSSLPPSVLVSELLDYLDQGFSTPGLERISGHIIIKHRLQGFNPAYFRNEKELFSYSREDCDGASCLTEHGRKREAFITKGLSPPAPEWKNVDISTLIAFFRNPARFLIERRLNMRFPETEIILEDAEPFTMEGLERYDVEQQLVEKELAGSDVKDLWPVFKASGILPHGSVGEHHMQVLGAGVHRFIENGRPYFMDNSLPPLDVSLDLSGFILRGRLSSLFRNHMVHYRYAPIKGRDLMRAWICHLALNSVKEDGYPRETLLFGKDASWRFSVREDAPFIMTSLLELYWCGLVNPLKFFPDAAWEYARHSYGGKKTKAESLYATRKNWEASREKGYGEGNDAAVRLCFENMDSLDEEFQHNVDNVFGMMMDCISHL